MSIFTGFRRILITKKKAWPLFLGLCLTTLFLFAAVLKPPVIEQMSNLLFDRYQRISPREYKPDMAPVRIIDIDNESLDKLGQWPWPRSLMGRLNDRLNEAGAAVIAYDITFSEPDRTSPENIIKVLRANPAATDEFENIQALKGHDDMFAESLSRSRSVLGFFLTRNSSDTAPEMSGRLSWGGANLDNLIDNFQGAIAPLHVFQESMTGLGFVSFNPEGDGIIRKAPMIYRIEDQYYRSLSLETLRTAMRLGAVIVRMSNGTEEVMTGADVEDVEIAKLNLENFTIPTLPDGSFRIYYTEPKDNERYISAHEILSEDIPISAWADKVAGHIVFVGTGADGLKDLVSTPIRAREPGVLVHAQIVEQVITGDYLKRPYTISRIENVILLICGLFLSFTLPFVGSVWRALITASLAAAVYYASWWAFKEHLTLLSPVYALLAIITIYILMTLASFFLTETERSRIRSAFSMYLSPTLVKKVSEDPSLLTLGGEDRNMTILFLDIRSFSKISHDLNPQEITSFLNIFLTPMTDILLSGKATIDKYIGDAIVAFWNAPLDDEEHEKNAARAVLEMNRELERLNQKYERQDVIKWPKNVSMGVGLNTGVCCVGNLGSEQRFSYSMIGDAANLASRIEGLTKQYKVSVLIGDETARALQDFALLEADKVQVIGRETPEPIYYLAGDEAVKLDNDFEALRAQHQAFLAAYKTQDWVQAETLLASAQKLAKPFEFDGYYDVMKDRITTYKISPPPENWDGVHVATSK